MSRWWWLRIGLTGLFCPGRVEQIFKRRMEQQAGRLIVAALMAAASKKHETRH